MIDIVDIDPTLPVVKNMLLLDSEGKRIAVNYYSSEWCVNESSALCFELSLCFV